MLKANALTNVERLASYMGIDTPASGSALELSLHATINGISTFIERYTGMKFKKSTYTQEVYDTEHGQTLNLKNFPVISSEPFILERRGNTLNEGDWEVIDGSYYTVDEEAGMITMMGGIHFGRTRQGYRVTYTAGYDFDNIATFLGDTEAGDVELAVWMMGQDLQDSKGGQSTAGVKSERIGDYAVTYSESMQSMFQNPQAVQILNAYKDGGESLGVLTPYQS
jgi:hypothetical protein